MDAQEDSLVEMRFVLPNQGKSVYAGADDDTAAAAADSNGDAELDTVAERFHKDVIESAATVTGLAPFR